MTTLSARYVRQPRKRYVCDWCERAITGPYIRLYGNPDYGPMWTLRLHPAEPCCKMGTNDPKVRAAMEQAAQDSPVVAPPQAGGAIVKVGRCPCCGRAWKGK